VWLGHFLEVAGLKVTVAVARDIKPLVGRTEEEEHHWKQQRKVQTPEISHSKKTVLLQGVQVGKVLGRVSHEN